MTHNWIEVIKSGVHLPKPAVFLAGAVQKIWDLLTESQSWPVSGEAGHLLYLTPMSSPFSGGMREPTASSHQKKKKKEKCRVRAA